MIERDIERALVKDVTKLLLELGTGFAFLGNQYCINVGGDDFYIDLLFYNLNLRCYVVIELKTGDFKPEYAGQLNFYLSAVDGNRAGQSLRWIAPMQKQERLGRRIFAERYEQANWRQ